MASAVERLQRVLRARRRDRARSGDYGDDVEAVLRPGEPVFALVADTGGSLEGLAHYLYHRSTTRVEPVCYLQDLYTTPARRGHGIGRALIEGAYAEARRAGLQRVYWQTQESNTPGRRLYERIARHHGFIVYSHDV